MHTDTDIIDALGGTAAVAAICRIKPPSVSDWRKTGIPPARRQFLELLRPDVFAAAARRKRRVIPIKRPKPLPRKTVKKRGVRRG